MNILKFPFSAAEVPEQLKLYKNMIVDEIIMPDYRLVLAPSAIPLGGIRIAALDGGHMLWFASPEDGALMRCSLLGGAAARLGERVENRAVDALYIEDGRLWALCGGDVFAFSVPPAERVSPLGKLPRQKLPQYFLKEDKRIGVPVRAAIERSKRFAQDDLTLAIGNVAALCGDGEGGRFVALKNGVMHFSAKAAFDRRPVELYHGGRYVFGNDASIEGIAWLDNALWVENALGYVCVRHERLSLSQKELHYDRLAWELHSVRGSLCDTFYETEDFGNGGAYEQTLRYSTNNDALWSVFHSIGDALKLSCQRRSQDGAGYEETREKLIAVTKNVLLQSHVHGLGNGFVCRSYISRKDGVFVKNGELQTNGLWYHKNGRDEDGARCVECVDTPLARTGYDPEDGKDFRLTDAVKARQKTSAVFPVEDGFRLRAPIAAQVPPLLASLYTEPDAYSPEKYPASEDCDLMFKADTSSEEAIAAFVQYYFVWKHLISQSDREEDAELGELILQTAAQTITHILDNGYCLRDLHGNPTQWGKWFAGYFVQWNDLKTPWPHPRYAFTDGPLNGAEILCMFKVCMYLMQGRPAYRCVYERVAGEYEKAFNLPFDGLTNGAGYASLLGKYRKNLAFAVRATSGLENYTLGVNYSDETLAVITYWPLLELEEDPRRRAVFSAGLDEWWDNMRREGNPIYTFAYAALNPEKEVDMHDAVDYLNRLPLYANQMPVTNSARNDLIMLVCKKGLQANALLPIDERRMHKFNGSPFEVDANGKNGQTLYEGGYLYSGNIFTWPYWTAKYYNLADLD
ncbi:MAG: hypothetical protein LBS36_01425 [Oscillospiraceae bacterium]|nr:hypothetical protein [Oscillospiraceae bacterium]